MDRESPVVDELLSGIPGAHADYFTGIPHHERINYEMEKILRKVSVEVGRPVLADEVRRGVRSLNGIDSEWEATFPSQEGDVDFAF